MSGARLTVEQRRTIERSYRIGLSQGQIASIIGKHPATVSRELKRSFSAPGSRSPQVRAARGSGQGYRRPYNAERAHRFAEIGARRPKCRRLDHVPLREKVWEFLRLDWSPEQIAAMLPVLFPNDPDMRVSHETIYQTLFIQTKGELKRELAAHLRSRRTKRQTRGSNGQRRHAIKDMISISDRPAEVEDRAVPGHWEGDLILGAVGKGAVITLVERSSRFVLLAPLPQRHTADLCRKEVVTLMERMPLQLRRSLTWDRGTEMAQHAQFSIETSIPVFFCDPHSPWQRGTNENTNGLLRQYWPKGSDLTRLTQTDCDDVALRLNTRPRETLEWQTPGQALNKRLVATAV